VQNSHYKIFPQFFSLMPEDALRVPMAEVLRALESAFGDQCYAAFDLSASVPSPVGHHSDTAWIKTANTVGVNVRTIGHFWNLVPYALTLPPAQNAIHILPIWEPGVVASLYGPASWNINPEFFSHELSETFPHLDTVEKQLKVVVNVLHLLGKTVGMDVVPHTDRYSEMAVANPQIFEWLQRQDLSITRHNSQLFEDVQAVLHQFLAQRGSAAPEIQVPDNQQDLFQNCDENTRLRILFGEKHDYEGRLHRRKELVELLYQLGYETVPATMGPPYRGIEVDPSPDAKVTDEEGRIWRDYRITRPEKFSRVFGPLARYRLYESKDDNAHWALDFEHPNVAAWDYACAHYCQIQRAFNFDFMRGDMSHVQMRPEGVPAERDEYYDLLGAVKQRVLTEKPYFGYFAESFLAPPGEMAFGDECDHLEASFADSTLGDLQAEPVGTQKFVRDFAQYRQWLETRQFAPNFTLMTADKDDPRFDSFYLDGNEMRYFIALFLTDMPSYMGLGFECRDVHLMPAPNEHYTKLYVFQEKQGPKATRGPYRWGQNRQLYLQLLRQKNLAVSIFESIENARTHWLLPPDFAGERKILAWTQAENPLYVFVANLDTKNGLEALLVPMEGARWKCIFSTLRAEPPAGENVAAGILVENIQPGEGLVFECSQN
jgi:hypothetical protein